ncbi:MAG: metallophosphoesterase family protein, partial [Robiginitalea sp.]
MGNTIEYTKYKKFVSPCRFDKGWIPSLFLLLLAGSCATYAPKYENPATARDVPDTPKVSHTFYLIGDAGLSPPDSMNNVLLHLRDRLEKASEKSTVVFLGDNIYPSGMPGPKKSPEAYREAKNNLDAQLKTLERYKGQPVFIPGNHDWYSNGLKGLKRQEKYVEDYLDRKGVFLPEDGCPLAQKQITEDILLITVDSKWYLSNWDRRPSINDDCAIKSREKFWAELEGAIKKNADKTIILAIHHPMFTYGEHGGQFSFRQQFYPSK